MISPKMMNLKDDDNDDDARVGGDSDDDGDDDGDSALQKMIKLRPKLLSA